MGEIIKCNHKWEDKYSNCYRRSYVSLPSSKIPLCCRPGISQAFLIMLLCITNMMGDMWEPCWPYDIYTGLQRTDRSNILAGALSTQVPYQQVYLNGKCLAPSVEATRLVISHKENVSYKCQKEFLLLFTSRWIMTPFVCFQLIWPWADDTGTDS